jgi:hypothetical protein
VSKYHNTKTIYDGQSFRSKKEAARYRDLCLEQKSGLIAGLTREVPFVLAPGVRIGEERKIPDLRYIADFVYSDVETGNIIVEDCKGMKTAVYKIKRHLMKTVHNIEVLET